MTSSTTMTNRRWIVPLFVILPFVCWAFTTPVVVEPRRSSPSLLLLLAKKKQTKTTQESAATATLLEEEETPAGVAGAEFFGGNRQKEEFYDKDAELLSDNVLAPRKGVFDRFQDSNAFPTKQCRMVAKSLQNQINNALYEETEEGDSDNREEEEEDTYAYASNLVWETPLSIDEASRTPLDELEKALDFYKRVDAAVISAEPQQDPSTVLVRWEVSVTWPNFYESHVLVTGSSLLTMSGKSIVRQVDTLDNQDMAASIGSQVIPRFWDAYHIGMSRSAELMPRLPSSAKKGLLSRYEVFEIPPRLVLRPSMLDIGTREEGYAQIIPNHAFSTTIKTMGPKRQRYIATNPVEVQISRSNNSDSNKPRITWTIPLAVELLSGSKLPIAGDDEETSPDALADVGYEFQSRRRVATAPFGGFPQDAEVAAVRQGLYEQVVKDGHKPKLDNDGRPIFLFLQNDAKACYTEGGLGMAIYDWRPPFVKANEVGIELEC